MEETLRATLKDAAFGAAVGCGGRVAANCAGAVVDLLRAKKSRLAPASVAALLSANDVRGWAAFLAALKASHGLVLRWLPPSAADGDGAPPSAPAGATSSPRAFAAQYRHWIAGGAAGLCLSLAPASYRRSVTLFTLMRALEAQSAMCQAQGLFPTFGDQGDIVSMMLASGIIIFAFIAAPHLHGGSYNRFLLGQMGVSKEVYVAIGQMLRGEPLSLVELNAHRAALGRAPISDALLHTRRADAFDDVLYDGTPLWRWAASYMYRGIFVRALPVYAPIALFTLARVALKRARRRVAAQKAARTAAATLRRSAAAAASAPPPPPALLREKWSNATPFAQRDRALTTHAERDDSPAGTPASASASAGSTGAGTPRLSGDESGAQFRAGGAATPKRGARRELLLVPPSDATASAARLDAGATLGARGGADAVAKRAPPPSWVAVFTRLGRDLMLSSTFLAGYCCLAIGMFGVMNRAGLTSRGDVLGRANARWNGFAAGAFGGAVVAVEHKARRILLALYVGQKAVDVLLRAVAEQAAKPAGENFKVRRRARRRAGRAAAAAPSLRRAPPSRLTRTSFLRLPVAPCAGRSAPPHSRNARRRCGVGSSAFSPSALSSSSPSARSCTRTTATRRSPATASCAARSCGSSAPLQGQRREGGGA